MSGRRKRTNFLDMERILVGSGDQPLAQGTLVNNTFALGIEDMQLGVMSADHSSTVAPYGTFLPAGTTALDVCAIQLIQGTPHSKKITEADIGFQCDHKAYESTPVIHRDFVRSIQTATCKVPCNSTQIVYNFNADHGIPNALYSLYIENTSVAADKMYGDNSHVRYYGYETPDYALMPNIVNPLDHMLQHIIFNMQKSSRIVRIPNTAYGYGNEPHITFGLNVAGGAGTAIGGIVMGDLIDVVCCGDQIFQYCADKDFINTLNKWIVCDNDITAATTIECINLAEAGTDTGAIVDAFAIMGLTRRIAKAYDDVTQRKNLVTVNLSEAFLAQPYPTIDCCTHPYYEGAGQGRDWYIRYCERWRMNRGNAQIFPHGDFNWEPPQYIDVNKSYTSYIIDYIDYEETLTHEQPTQKQAVILLECVCDDDQADAATGYTTSTLDQTTVADLNAILGAWLNSTSRTGFSDMKYLVEATAATPFI